MNAYYTMTDDPVISADCAMTDDLSISARVIVWVVCIPTLSPYGLIRPLWLDGHFLLVDKDYVSHLF
jgi:hypothetical protein